MNLYLIRHAEAETLGDRALTELGRQQSIQLAKTLVQNFTDPDVVLTSPVLRAKQTAEIICNNLEGKQPLLESWLASGMAPHDALSGLAGYQSFSTVVMVGHEPDLSYFIMSLLSSDKLSFKVQKASLTVLSGVLVNQSKATFVEYRSV